MGQGRSQLQPQLPAPTLDGEALGIKGPLESKKKWAGYGEKMTHTSGVGVDALHIKGALDAQKLQGRYQRKLDKHHFPPHIVSKYLIFCFQLCQDFMYYFV